MRPPPRVVRRAVVDPVLLATALVLAVVLGAVVVLCSPLAPFRPRRRLMRVTGFAAGYLLIDASLVVAGTALWLRRQLGGLLDDDVWVAAHTRLLHRTLQRLITMARRTVGFQVQLDPASTPPPGNRPLILLARHAGPGDSFALGWLVLEHLHRVPRVVLKDVLLWDPGLDIVLTRLSGCFLPSHTGAGEDNADRIATAAATLAPGDALVLFPEGGNWTPDRHRRAIRRLWHAGRRRAARRAAAMPRLLPPRPAGATAALAARPDVDALVVAHAGLDQLTTVRDIYSAVPFHNRPMRVHWWTTPAADVPRNPDAIPDWLNSQWTAVGRWVDAIHGSRTTIPAPAVPPPVEDVIGGAESRAEA